MCTRDRLQWVDETLRFPVLEHTTSSNTEVTDLAMDCIVSVCYLSQLTYLFTHLLKKTNRIYEVLTMNIELNRRRIRVLSFSILYSDFYNQPRSTRFLLDRLFIVLHLPLCTVYHVHYTIQGI